MNAYTHAATWQHPAVTADNIYTGSAGRACEACNKKKTKCDRKQPVCGLCRRTRHACVFPSSRKRPSRQDPSTRAKMQKIDGNIDRLLEILEANPYLEGNTSRFNGESTIRETLAAQQTTEASKLAKPLNTASLVTPTHTPPAAQQQSKDSLQASSTNASSLATTVDFELAIHLINVFFEAVQPWSGLLHKPSFLKWSQKILAPGDDALRYLGAHEKALLLVIFALAARFSDHWSIAGPHPRDRGAKFGRQAECCLSSIEDNENQSTTGIQACILVSLYQYCSGHSQRGWKTASTCIQACYELRLHEIDEEDDEEGTEGSQAAGEEERIRWIEREQRRRLFWFIWEIDLFASILKRRPLGIAWRHIKVRLPVSDEAWFAGNIVDSKRFIAGPECWKSLVDSANQDERAWSILAKSLIGWYTDLALLKEDITLEQKSSFENNLGCFRLTMPETCHLSSSWLDSKLPIATKNFAVATSIYLSASACVISQLPVSNNPHIRTREEHDAQQLATYRDRAVDLCNIMRRWPPQSVMYAAPTLACALLTFNESLFKLLPANEFENSYSDLAELILSKFAERWTLAAIILKARDLAHSKRQADSSADAELVKEYPVYFNKFVTWKQEPRSYFGVGNSTYSAKQNESNNAKDSADSSSEGYKTPSDSVMMTQSPQFQGSVSKQTEKNSGDIAVSASRIGTEPRYDVSCGSVPMHRTPDPTNVSFYADINYATSEDVLEPMNISGFESISMLDNSSPQDFDTLFSGFLQEPLWQDFQSTNFLV